MKPRHIALMSWLQPNHFLHGKSTTYFFKGVSGHGKGDTADASMSPLWIETHNFATVSPFSITAPNLPHDVTKGVKMNVVCRLFVCLDGTNAVGLQRRGVLGYLVVAASDAMAIKPGLQCSLSCNGIVGLIKPNVLSLNEVKDLTKKAESEIVNYLKTCQFN